MSLRIRFTMFAAASVAAVALSACGDDTPKKPAEAPAAQQSAPVAKVAAAPASADRLKGCTLNAYTERNKTSPVLCADLEVTGAKTLKLSNSTIAPNESCAVWVKKRAIDPNETLRWSGEMAAAGQTPVDASFTVYDYQGPGAYTESQGPGANTKSKVMDGGGGQTGIQFGVYGGSGSEYFTMNSDMTVLVPGAKATLDVKADGNVKLVLTGLHPPGL